MVVVGGWGGAISCGLSHSSAVRYQHSIICCHCSCSTLGGANASIKTVTRIIVSLEVLLSNLQQSIVQCFLAAYKLVCRHCSRWCSIEHVVANRLQCAWRRCIEQQKPVQHPFVSCFVFIPLISPALHATAWPIHAALYSVGRFIIPANMRDTKYSTD